MRAQTILFLSVDGVKEKLDCRPYRGGGEGQSQETTRGCKPRLFKPVDYFDHTTCYSEKTGLRLVLASHSRPFALDAAWVGKRPGLVSLRRPLEDEAQRRAALLPGARDL